MNLINNCCTSRCYNLIVALTIISKIVYNFNIRVINIYLTSLINYKLSTSKLSLINYKLSN